MEEFIQSIQFVANNKIVQFIVYIVKPVNISVYTIAIVSVVCIIHFKFSPLGCAVLQQSVYPAYGRHDPISSPFHIRHIIT